MWQAPFEKRIEIRCFGFRMKSREAVQDNSTFCCTQSRKEAVIIQFLQPTLHCLMKNCPVLQDSGMQYNRGHQQQLYLSFRIPSRKIVLKSIIRQPCAWEREQKDGFKGCNRFPQPNKLRRRCPQQPFDVSPSKSNISVMDETSPSNACTSFKC